ncbi:tachykinin-like peptides receptor 86C [Clytia hemisphaerica]|uniref:tachykinin-like peptides receptor 86C n=1 Tax=Clytia hemisphaerica TaxID=252671 RepID=UPI0034D50343
MEAMTGTDHSSINTTQNFTKYDDSPPIPISIPAIMPGHLPPFLPSNKEDQNNITEANQRGHSNMEIIIIFEGAFIVLVNLFFLTCILLKRKTRRMKETRFLLNLQFTHVLVGVNSFVYYSKGYTESIMIANLLLLQVFLGLICMTLERFLSIIYPFKMRQSSTRYHYILISISWLLIGLLTALGLVYFEDITGHQNNDNRVFLMFSTALVSIAILLLAFTNFKLLLIARKHFKEIGKTLVREKTEICKRNSKATYTCIIIVASFIILWLPQLIHNILSLLNIYQAGKDRLLTQIVWLIAMIDSIVNPFVHMCFNRGIRQMVKRMSNRKSTIERTKHNNETVSSKHTVVSKDRVKSHIENVAE